MIEQLALDVDPLVVVWFSCGAASAVAAKLTLDLYPNARIVNNPVAEEDPDNRRFLLDVQKWLGVEIESAVNMRYPDGKCVDVWADRRFMSGVRGAPCTLELKKEARRQWETVNRPDWHVLGFTVDEKGRYERFVANERANSLPILIDAGLTKQDCFDIITKAGIELPYAYRAGLPNANCIGCVKATSPTYWNHVRKVWPDVFAERAVQSRDIGAKLVRVKNERIYLDELDPNAVGRPMKSMQIDCGIFCEKEDEE